MNPAAAIKIADRGVEIVIVTPELTVQRFMARQ